MYGNVPYYCYETKKRAEQLGRKSDLHLLWTAGQKAIAGNEKADCLVKRAATNTRLLTTPSKISFKLIISNLKESIQIKREQIWNLSTSGQLTKRFLPTNHLTDVLNKRHMTRAWILM